MSYAMIDEGSITVSLNGLRLVWLKNPDGTGALAFPHHIDEDGHVMLEHCCSESYAHVCADGCIRRYGTVIGSVGDLCTDIKGARE